MLVFDFLLGILLVVVMMVSSGAAVGVFEKLTHEIRAKKLLLATILVGFSTSLPEFFVGIESALRGHSALALGDILGANIANMSWIVGGAAMVAGAIPVVGEYLKKDLWVTMVAATMPLVLILDGSLSRIDGLILVVVYVIYVVDLLRSGGSVAGRSGLYRNTRVVHHRLKTKIHWFVEAVKLLFFLGLLAASSWILINMALKVALVLGVSYFWVGLLVLAVGTTLPELIVSMTATKMRDVSLVLGNVFGSVVVNSTLILGLVVLINPIGQSETLSQGISGIFLLTILGIFWLFTKSKHRLDRWEGAVLVGIYAMFVGIQMMFA